MGFFNRKTIEKESKIASTPKDKLPMQEFSRMKFFLLLWNIISIGLYCIYIAYLVLHTAQGKFLSTFIIWLLYIYVGIFILILIISIFQKNKLKDRLKNYKSAINFFKYFIQLVTFVLSIITAISTFLTTGKTDTVALKSAIFSLGFTVVMIVFEVVKILIRRNMPTVKQNFLVIREKREEQLILSGKKERKYDFDENRITYHDDDGNEIEDEDNSDEEDREQNKEKFARGVVYDDEDNNDFINSSKSNKEKYARKVVYDEEDDDENMPVLGDPEIDNASKLNNDGEMQVSKFKKLYKSILKKFKKEK